MSLGIFNRKPQPCLYLRIGCPNCGDIRMAIKPEIVPDTINCPHCQKPAPASHLGSGETVRLLPFFERMRGLVDKLERNPGKPVNAILDTGAVVIYSDEPGIYHICRVTQVWVTQQSVSRTGMPGVVFHLEGEDTPVVKHFSAEDALPFWCFPHEIGAASQKFPGQSVIPVPEEPAKATPKKKSKKKASNRKTECVA